MELTKSITYEGSFENDPSWSPDGTKIAFTSRSQPNDFSGAEILVLDFAKPWEFQQLTNNSVEDMQPSWSPDGTQIAYVQGGSHPYEIHVMDADGSGDRKVADGVEPEWSPDGSKIVYTDRSEGEVVKVMNPDGSEKTVLTASGSQRPTWSPDGSRIIFERAAGIPNWDLYIMNADGSDQVPLITHESYDGDADWQSVAVDQAAPVFSFIGDKTALLGEEVKFKVYAHDPNNDPVTYSLGNGPIDSSFDEAARTFTWTPTLNDVGINPILFVATDPSGFAGELRVTINVREALFGFGDSVAAGHGLGDPGGYPGNPSDAYPTVLAKLLDVEGFNFAISGACAATLGEGADPNTPDSWSGSPKCQTSVLTDELGNQPLPVAGTPSIITLTIGANDILFSECFRALFDKTFSDPCSSDTLPLHLLALRNNLGRVLAEIKARYPSSRIVLTKYYNPFPPPPISDADTCDLFYPIVFQRSPDLLATPSLLKGAVKQAQAETYVFARWVMTHLNAAIQSSADDASVETVQLDFTGHDLCRTRMGGSVSETWIFGPKANISGYWNLGLDSGGFNFNFLLPEACPNQSREASIATGSSTKSNYGYFYSLHSNCAPHPTAAGQREIARAIRSAL